MSEDNPAISLLREKINVVLVWLVDQYYHGNIENTCAHIMCVCVCVCACVRACVRACARARARACVCAFIRVRTLCVYFKRKTPYLHDRFTLKKPLQPAILEHPGLSHDVKEVDAVSDGADLKERQRARPAQVDPLGIHGNELFLLQSLHRPLARRHAVHDLI